MTVPGPLPLRVRPKPHETPASLLDRLSARHRELDPAAFGRSYALDRRALLFGHGVDRLVTLAGFGRDATTLIIPRADPRTRTVALGHGIVALGDWNADGGRYCPGCVAEDVETALAAGRRPEAETYRRFWWDVGSLTHCHRHGAALRTSCPRCGAATAWGGSPGRCRHCRGSLGRRAVRTAQPPGLSRYLQARLVGAATQVPLLDGMQVKNVVTQVARIGLALTAGQSRPKPRDDAYDISALRAAGFAAAVAWPATFIAGLDRLLAAASRQPAAACGMIGSYGWVYEHWVEPLDPATTFGGAVRAAVRDHAVRNGVIPESDPALANRASKSETTLTAAARVLGWGYERTKREARRRGLVGLGARRGVGIHVDLSVLQGSPDMRGRLTLAQVGARLGVGKAQAGRIAAAGLLGPRVGGTHATVGPEDCDRLLEGVVSGLSRLATLPPEAETLPRACRFRQVPLETACRLLLDGTVRPLGLVGQGATLANIALRVGDLPRPLLRDPEIATVEEAARRLGLHHETVRYLGRDGFLHRVRDGRVAGFRNSTLRRFDESHLSGTEVARALGTSPRAAARRLAAAGIRPVVAPPDCRQLLFLRADVDRQIRMASR